MAEALLSPFIDLFKHYVQINYITFDDNKLNLLIYSCLTILMSFIVKTLCNYKDFMNHIKYIKWFYKYKILNTKITIYPCSNITCMYAPFDLKKDTENNVYSEIELFDNNKTIFLRIFGFRLEKYSYGNNNNISTHRYTFKLPDDKEEICRAKNLIKDKFKVTPKTFNGFFKSIDEKDITLKIIAYIDGYYICLNLTAFVQNRKDVIISSNNRNALEKFLSILQNDLELNKSRLDEFVHSRQIVEYDRETETITLGQIKPNLTFDHYVSRHKQYIIQKLNSFLNCNLYKNPYIENNLGFMLHGDYGTGKTFLISAIANYLNRSIYSVNFTKIKSKKIFMEIMHPDKAKQYVYSFDEFDYLLLELLDNEKQDNNTAVLQLKIQALSTQINSCSDKESTKPLVDELKKLMENGNDDKLSLSFVLGILSGLTSITDRVIVATTNNMEKIPPALLRPGRFDININLGRFNNNETKELLIKLFKNSDGGLNEENLRLIKNTTFPSDKFTPSHIIMKSCEYTNIKDMIKYLIKDENSSRDFS